MKFPIASLCALLVGFVSQSQAAEESAIEKKPVTLIVKLPADATLELLGQKTEGAGAERRFGTPPLEVGKRYPYSLKATWTVNGKTESFEHKITVTPGTIHEVVFTSAAGGGTSQEQEVLALVNQQRAAAGAPALVWNETLGNAARMHSANMAQQNTLSHDLGGSFVARVQQAGGGVSPAGENIAQGQQSSAEVVRSWMNSDGHRANIMNSGFTSIGVGVGVAASSGGELFWTQVFGR